MSTQGNQQLSSYVSSNVIECLEQNIQKQIDCKRPSSTKQMNRVQNIRIEICKQKYNQGKFRTCSFYFYWGVVLSYLSI